MASQMNQSLILVVAGALTLALGASGCGEWKEKSKSAKFPFGVDGGETTGNGGEDEPEGSTGLDLTGFDLTLNTYESCEALQQDVREQLQAQASNDRAQREYWRKQGSRAESASIEASTASDMVPNASVDSEKSDAGGGEQITNVQEKGVDEADFAKLGTDHFYVSHGAKIEVLDRIALTVLGQLDLAGMSQVTLYAEADRLIMIGWNNGQTLVRTYTAAKGQMPTVANERRYPDQYTDSRFVAGKVILLFSSSLPMTQENDHRYGYYGYDDVETPIPDQPITILDGKVGGIACASISKPYVKDLDFRLTKVVTFDSRDLARADQSAATLGGGDQVYMTPTGLYLAKQGIQWHPWFPMADGGDYEAYYAKQRMLYETLVVTRIAFAAETGAVSAQAVGAVSGYAKDQWAFKEYVEHGVLAIATTTSAKFRPETTTEGQHNHLWILQQEDKTLALKASINDFGPREDIRAARYLGTMAYIVTFEKTDPLFAFDLANPLEPKLMSELKIPGFSMYLHPTSDGRLVGVGYDADDQGQFSWFQGIQVSLFDISNPLALSRLDVKVIGDRGTYSDVTGDHKAFYENKEHHLIGIPVVEKLKDEKAGKGGWEQGQRLGFTGAILYDLGGDKLEEKARLSHSDLFSEECKKNSGNDFHWWQDSARSLDINRLYTIDGRLITVSRFGVRAHDLSAPTQVLSTTPFAADDQDCPRNDFPYPND